MLENDEALDGAAGDQEVVIPNAVLLVPGIECRILQNGEVRIQPFSTHLNRGEPARSLGGRPFPDPIVQKPFANQTKTSWGIELRPLSLQTPQRMAR